MKIERIYINARGRRELIVLKRRTGLSQWNHLCRWAFCVSLADPTPLPDVELDSASAVEMTWQTFGGVHAPTYHAMLLVRCRRDGILLKPEAINRAFHLHLHRGIAQLYGLRNVNDMADLIRSARRLVTGARQ